MIQLIPIATIFVIVIGWIGMQKGIDWLFQRQKQALNQFWDVSTAILTEIATITSKPMETEEGPPPLPARTSHTQRVHDLEVQPALEYHKLSNNRAEMRLLRLYAASDYDELIQCSLQRSDLETDLPYTALSYCWGDTTNPNAILVDGQVVNVTQNLYLALRELRFIGTEYVWIDALCIDQRNAIELQQQIQRMTMIYGRATTVFAWLGQSDICVEGLGDTFEKLKSDDYHTHKSVLNRILLVWLQELGIFEERRITRRITQMAFPKIGNILKRFAPDLSDDDRSLHAKKLAFIDQLQNVLSREYWRRAWILQELTVAGDIRLRCGHVELDFGLLSGVINELEVLHSSGIFQPFTPYHQHVFNIVVLRRKWRPREPIHLLSALRESFHTRSTKSHDKIYSLFSVCFDSSRFVTAVDYDTPMERLVRRMTINSIQATRTIDVICMQGLWRNPVTPLPSWAPDWPSIGSHQFNNRMIGYLTGLDEHPREDPRDRYWRATSESLCAVSPFTEDASVLIVRGKSVGFITNYSGTIEEAIDSGVSGRSDTVHTHRVLPVVKRLLGGQEARGGVESIFSTLTLYKSKVRLDDENFAFNDLWSSSVLASLQKEEPLVHAWLEKHREFIIHGKPLIWWSRGIFSRTDIEQRLFGKAARFLYHASHDEDFSWDKRIKDLVAAVTRALQDGLRLMETSEGMTGWAHPTTQRGDEIFLLQGCSIPVILRPLEGKQQQPAYEVVGDAYVDGLMYGEAWTGDQDLVNLYLY